MLLMLQQEKIKVKCLILTKINTDHFVPCCRLITWYDINATLCPSLGTPVARAEVDTAVTGSLVPCVEAMEQKRSKVIGI